MEYYKIGKFYFCRMSGFKEVYQIIDINGEDFEIQYLSSNSLDEYHFDSIDGDLMAELSDYEKLVYGV